MTGLHFGFSAVSLALAVPFGVAGLLTLALTCDRGAWPSHRNDFDQPAWGSGCEPPWSFSVNTDGRESPPVCCPWWLSCRVTAAVAAGVIGLPDRWGLLILGILCLVLVPCKVLQVVDAMRSRLPDT